MMGNLMLTILTCMAQMEREMMLQRQSEGIAAAHAAGHRGVREQCLDRQGRDHCGPRHRAKPANCGQRVRGVVIDRAAGAERGCTIV